MAGEKRSFPYYSAVPEIDLKRRAVEGRNPGLESKPADVFELPDLDDLDPSDTATSDFSKWNDSEIKVFLEKRGEDYDDCQTREQLVSRAVQCEFTTGPAEQPEPDAIEGDGDDPLDAFMLEMQQMVDEQKKEPKETGKPRKADLEDEEDHVADFMEARQQNGRGGLSYVAEGYNSDDEVYATDKAMQQAQGDGEEAPQGRQQIAPLPALDHDDIAYPPFAKDFYTPVHKIASMTPGEVNAMRRQLAIRVSGFDAPGPVETFQQCGLDAPMLAVIKGMKYQNPTAIQAQALPAALSGRDVLGIAKTGSGKTAAFLIPMFVHIQDQPELEKGEGPIGIVAAPTRELAEQIHKEARKFGKPYGMRVAAGIGGLSKFEQFKDLKSGADAMVCTPGRLIDLIKMKGCTLRRTTYIVFDEADRMFDMGFEPQVRSIIGQIRPDRQTLLFSATMPTKVERLVRDALTSPVRVSVGEIGAANEDIKQVVSIVPEAKKVEWLLSRLPEMIDSGEVLVFANQIVRVEEVTEKIKALGHRVLAIHGDMSQHSRTQALKEFSMGRQHILVATDVAARGLDIKSIKNVVNLDAAKDIDTHVHRVGRTGRAGDKEGTAHTLLTPKQSHFAGLLLNSMAAANQEISPELQALAMKDSRFSKGQTRSKGGAAKPPGGGKRRQQVGGAGVGFGSTQERDDPMKQLYGDRTEFTQGGNLGAGAKAEAGQPMVATAPEAPRNSVLGGPAPQAAPQPARPSTEAAPPPPFKPHQPKPEEPAGGVGVFGGQGFKGIMQNRFKSQFVASGTAGGDIGQKATIFAAKASKPQEVTPAPSFLAKKMTPAADQASAQQAIAAARAIAARLSGGAQTSETSAAAPYVQPPRSFPPAPSSGRPNPPPGYGSSASAYPDLSEQRGGGRGRGLSDERTSSARAGREERERGRLFEADRGTDRSSRYSDRGPPASSRPPQARYGGGGGGGRGGGGGGMGSSASAYPDLSRDRERSRGSGFSGEGAPAAQATGFGGPASGFGPPPAAASYPAPPQQVPNAAPSYLAPQPYGVPNAHPPPYAQPTPQAGGANLQASVAAAQAIAARLTAQAGSAPPPLPGGPPPPRLGEPPAAQDSIAATIAAAKAITARMGGGGGPVLNNPPPNAGGQWAWGKG